MQFLTPEAPAEDVSLNQLIELISRGELPPHTLLRDKILTKGQWRTIDNLRLFHKYSPLEHPYGPHLRQQLENDRRKQQQRRRVAKLHHAYSSGTMIEEQYQLQPLSRITSKQGVEGAARLFILDSFDPEQICTIVFGADTLSVEMKVGHTPLFWSLPQLRARTAPDGLWEEVHPQAFDAAHVHSATTTLSMEAAPGPFRSWATFLNEARQASATLSEYLGGVSYRHKVQDADTVLDVRWDDPHEKKHLVQHRLIKAYTACMNEISRGMNGVSTNGELC